jgi:hypothetical protein
MQTLTDLQVETSALASQLDTQLNRWTDAAQEQLQQLVIPQSTPELVREVLEELRDTYGSETVFLCGRIDLDTSPISSSADDPDRAYSAQLLVCWMGNVTAQVLPVMDQYVTLGGDDDRVARWSTLRGSRGPVTIWQRHLATIERLIVYTDGLNAIAPLLHNLDDKAWQAQTRQLHLLPDSDDMTALELKWQRQDQRQG